MQMIKTGAAIFSQFGDFVRAFMMIVENAPKINRVPGCWDSWNFGRSGGLAISAKLLSSLTFSQEYPWSTSSFRKSA